MEMPEMFPPDYYKVPNKLAINISVI